MKPLVTAQQLDEAIRNGSNPEAIASGATLTPTAKDILAAYQRKNGRESIMPKAAPMKPRNEFDPKSAPRWSNHMDDFLTCVRTGETPRCDIDEAFIEAVTFLMSVESYKQQRLVRWDAEQERVV